MHLLKVRRLTDLTVSWVAEQRRQTTGVLLVQEEHPTATSAVGSSTSCDSLLQKLSSESKSLQSMISRLGPSQFIYSTSTAKDHYLPYTPQDEDPEVRKKTT